MSIDRPPQPTHTRWWLAIVVILLAARLPTFVEPTGNDQNLYQYTADRVRSGGVPYRDAWDQKPPGVFFVYAAVRTVWPYSSAVALADTLAAALVAWLLILLARRSGVANGYVAASVFLLLGHPSLARLSGIYIRGQCEVFIGLAVTTAVTLLWTADRTRWRFVMAGAWLAVAVWLKYNAITYVLPMAALVWLRPSARWRSGAADLAWIGIGFVVVSSIALAYFAGYGALDDWRRATIDYNLTYSRETYSSGVSGAIAYVVTLPFQRASTDLLWYLGSAGLIAGVASTMSRQTTIVVAAWVAAAVLSIAVNGARSLPQYFVQATPPLAFATAIGIAAVVRQPRGWQVAGALVALAGLWRVGVEPTGYAPRMGGLPELVDNLRWDLAFTAGRLDRSAYLARFKGAQKYDASEIQALTEYVVQTTDTSDRLLVFGFAPGVYVDSRRESASRFFWSRPVIVEFAAGHPGYGSAGLRRDLERAPPALVVLQKQDWSPDTSNSLDFFLTTPVLRDWLIANYRPDRDTPIFQVWRRRS